MYEYGENIADLEPPEDIEVLPQANIADADITSYGGDEGQGGIGDEDVEFVDYGEPASPPPVEDYGPPPPLPARSAREGEAFVFEAPPATLVEGGRAPQPGFRGKQPEKRQGGFKGRPARRSVEAEELRKFGRTKGKRQSGLAVVRGVQV